MSTLDAQSRAAILMLTDDDSPILRVAREITEVCRAEGLQAAIIGGVAVFLQGYPRTTIDVDAWCADREAVRDALMRHGYEWDAADRGLKKHGVPVHLLVAEDLGHKPHYFEDRERIAVVSLAELLTLKLKTGTHQMSRAKDLADIVGLIKAGRVKASLSSRIAEDVRPEFRRIMRELGQASE